MRFRRSVRIIKGLKLNFSGSGISLTVGTRGLSYTVGKNGTYVNYGIPGTGLYNRTKIMNPREIMPDFYIEMDSEGVVYFYDKETDSMIYDEKIIRRMKKSESYKIQLNNIVYSMIEKIEKEEDNYIRLYMQFEKVNDTKSHENIFKNLTLQKYSKLEFLDNKPNIDEIIIELEEEAKNKISWLYFWKRKKLIKEYVEINKSEKFKEKINIWNNKKLKFENEEKEKEKKLNDKYLKEYQNMKHHLELTLKNDEEYLESLIGSVVNEIVFPLYYEFEYEIMGNRILIDLKLPEIFEMPKEKIKIMANGTAKVKNKTKKEIKEDYYNCVIGLTMLISNKIFNKCFGIEDIIISSYTQRLNKRKKEIDDVYIYSAYIRRENFIGKDFSIDGIFEELIYEVYSRISLGTDLSLNKIEPLDTEIVELIR